ncbi:hypothetical protein DCAR_0206955 [Daucus carota subsp. sativus]|uniref:Glycine-rich protein n=1 Tax=Daucus carota subsp. sativus TaxID=79200 RepID=A0AAF0WDQ8_DAUCS|nr:PREDICTED: keratin, type I cytoskeletal 10-like [Daucus carota subsp. sativus]WOG87724.1 hypothetical protein DCAR_0206955 [Daucus carota subsp. sativus]
MYMKILPVFLLFFRLQHLRASSYTSSPHSSLSASNKEQLIHKGYMLKQELEIEEKAVSSVNRRAGGGGGGHGGHGGAAHGSSHGGSHGHGVGGGDSSGLPKYGGVVAGAGAGGAYERNNHNSGKHSGASSCCVHPVHLHYLLSLATILRLTWPILV